METKAAATNLRAVCDLQNALALHAPEQQGETVDGELGAGQVHIGGANAEHAVAVGVCPLQLHVAVLHKHMGIVGAIHGEDAPAVGAHQAAVIVHRAVIRQLAETIGAPNGNAPAPVAHLHLGRDVVHLGVVHRDGAGAAYMNGAAGHRGKVDLTVVDGHIGVANGGHTGTHADKVIAALTVQGDSGPVDGVFALAVNHNTGKVRGGGGDKYILRLGAGDSSVLDNGGNPLAGNQLAVLDADGGLQRNGAFPADGGIGGLNHRLRHGQAHVTVVKALCHRMAAAIDGQSQVLSLRGLEHGTRLNGQKLGLDGLRHQVLAGGVNDFVHNSRNLLIAGMDRVLREAPDPFSYL